MQQLAAIHEQGLDLAANETILNRELTELREWEFAKVSWTIRNLESQLTHVEAEFQSKPYWVAGNPLRLCLEVDALDPYVGDNGRVVGFYVMHYDQNAGHSSLFPIQIGGTTVLLESGAAADKQKIYSKDACLDEAGSGVGWEAFSTLGDIRSSFMQRGNVTISATLRVKRRLVVSEI